MTFESRILEVHTRRHLVLAEAIYFNDKILTFRGTNIIVDVLVNLPDEKPQLFKNVTIKLVRKPDNSLCYNLLTIAESKTYNRRQNFRCFIGLPISFRFGTNRAARDAILRDISNTGFAIVCDEELDIDTNQVIHVLLNDRIEETAENYSFHLYGLISRIQELENGKHVYGCRFNNRIPGLESYIVKKERLSIQNRNK